MKPNTIQSLLLAVSFFPLALVAGQDFSPYARIKPMAIEEVKWTEGFWAEKFDLCRREMLPSIHNALRDKRNSEVLENLKIAAGLATGEYHGTEWSDGDCYKWIEAMGFMYALTKDPELEKLMDEWIGVIGKAQLPDGYISTNMQLRKRQPYMVHPGRKSYAGAYHEMYNLGHLLTAACSHYQSTGKENFLNVARKTADHLVQVMKTGAPELRVMCGNLPNVMGMVDMYRITGEKRYLDCAQVAVDIHGHQMIKSDLTQDHVPFREETEAVGHSVFATYLYAGVADIYQETGERGLWKALNRIWESAALRRTYITGGACAIPNGVSARGDSVHEAFGADYQLPNRTAYNETCANIGNAMWNWRMLQVTGDAKYADIMETVLYNSGLSPVSTDGKTFFYANPLMWNFQTNGCAAQHTAQRWSVFRCYCCPPQVARTIAGLGRWAYGVSKEGLWVHLYGGNYVETKLLDGSRITLTQSTDYPWDGHVKLTVNAAPRKSTSIMVRIPGWSEKASLAVNGKPITSGVKPGVYVPVKREWKSGDVIELDFPMPVRLMEANPRVEDDAGRVAVQRGPVVYCAEFPADQNGEQAWKQGVYLLENVKLTSQFEKDFLGGVVTLTGKALNTEGKSQFLLENARILETSKSQAKWKDELYRPFAPKDLKVATGNMLDLKLIPYFAWANRGPAYMEVWIPLAR